MSLELRHNICMDHQKEINAEYVVIIYCEEKVEIQRTHNEDTEDGDSVGGMFKHY